MQQVTRVLLTLLAICANQTPIYVSCQRDAMNQFVMISAQDEAGGKILSSAKMHRPAIWQRIRDNIYTARQRKEPDEDDIMICQCSCFARDDNSGCGAACLNRVLNIECEPVRALLQATS